MYFFLLITTSHSQPIKISGELTRGGNVSGFNVKITQDGRHVIYIADQDIDNRKELYQASIEGGSTIKLNHPLGSEEGISNFQITADNSRVIYEAFNFLNEEVHSELFSVPLLGGTPVKISTPIQSGRKIISYKLSPDGLWVVFQTGESNRLNSDGLPSQLFSVSSNGGTPTELSNNFISRPLRLSDEQYYISPDSTRVVYSDSHILPEVFGLFSIPISGGNTIELSDSLPSGDQIDQFRITSDGVNAKAIYFAATTDTGTGNLFSVPLEGGVSTKLNPGLEPESAISSSFKITPDGQRVLYSKNQGTAELFSVPTHGGEQASLLSNLVADDRIASFDIFPDSSSVLVWVSREDGSHEYFVIPVNGGAPRKIIDGFIKDKKITSDSSHLVFISDRETEGVWELFTISLMGGEPTKLSGLLVDQGGVGSFQITADDSRVIYRARKESKAQDEIFSVALTGGDSVKLNSPLPEEGNVFWIFHLTPDSSQVVYLANQEKEHVDELFASPVVPSLIPSNYPDFSSLFKLAGPFDGDDDGDQIPNGLEYVLALNPTIPDGSRFLYLSTHEDSKSLTFSIAQPGSNDVILSIEYSITFSESAPSNWIPLATRTNGVWSQDVISTPNGQGRSLISLQHEATESTRFYRLRATLGQ